MKKRGNILKSSILVGVFSLILASSGWTKDGKLADISRPYLGTYECETFRLGSEDKLDGFDFIRVELTTDGTLNLSYRPKGGETKTLPLAYEYDRESNMLTVYAKWGTIKTDKKFTLQNGEINASFSLGKYNVTAKFKK